MISREDYLGPYRGAASVTPGIEVALADLLRRVNGLLASAEAAGVTLERNPVTGTLISGQGNGGYRPPSCPVGAPNSAHKQGQAVDIYDPDGDLDGWCLDHEDALVRFGLYMEHPAATKGWCHLGTRAPRSGRRVFYP